MPHDTAEMTEYIMDIKKQSHLHLTLQHAGFDSTSLSRKTLVSPASTQGHLSLSAVGDKCGKENFLGEILLKV